MNNNINRNLVVGLDIGTTKIAAVVGYRDENGKINVVGHGKSVSTGVQYGQIQNIVRTVEGIKKSVEIASEKANVDIETVYIGIAGHHIKSNQYKHHGFRNGNPDPITQEELDTMQREVFNVNVPPGEEIVDVIPQRYIIDDKRVSNNPAGELGNKIAGLYQVITGQQAEIQKVSMCADRAELKIQEIILEPLASSIACLRENEKKEGVALIDIGGGTTDLIIYIDGNPVYTKVIAVGGDTVTSDIAKCCRVSEEVAEKLKIQRGTCIVSNSNSNAIISIPRPYGQAPIEINENYLARVINARVGEEIIKTVKSEIINSGFKDKLNGGIVLTGGGANLKDIKGLCEYELQMPARIGIPNIDFSPDIPVELKQPAYSTVMGLLKYGIEMDESYQEQLDEETNQEKSRPQKNRKKPNWGLFSKAHTYLKKILKEVS